MALLIDELAAYMQTKGLGTVGTSIFKVQRPAAPVVCTSLHPTGGYAPDRYTTREKPTVMIYARAVTPAAAMTRAYAVFNALHGKQNITLGTLHALTIEATSSPAYLETEQAGNGVAHLVGFSIWIDLRRPSS